MVKTPKIRMRQQDRAEIKRVNKLVSNKKSRVRKKYGEVQGVETIKANDFQTRKQYNNYMKKMKDFLDRDNNDYEVKNKENVVLKIKEVKAVEREIKRVNAKKKKELKKFENKPFMHGGKQIDTVGGRAKMGDERLARFKPLRFNLDRFRSRKEFEEYRGKFKDYYRGNFTKRQDEEYRKNYIKGLENVFGSMANDLIKAIKDMPIDDYMDKYYSQNFAELTYIYEPAEMRRKLKNIRETWGK